MKSTILKTLSILIAATISTACLGPTKSELAGQYRLITVDNLSLPAAVQHGPAEIKVVSGLMSFSNDGTCESQTRFVPPIGEAIDRKVSADYRRHGTKLTMTWHGAGQTNGEIRGEHFTMVNEGMVFEYERVTQPHADN